jgi:hypothetical protein
MAEQSLRYAAKEWAISNEAIKQSSKQVFLSQRNKEERLSSQSKQVVALRAKLINFLREAPKSLLSVHSIVLPCSSVIKTPSCLIACLR